MALRKKGWRGTEPITSFEIPVGMVRRTQAGKARSGSRLRLHPYGLSAMYLDGAGVTHVVQVNVDAAKVVKHKVADGIGALDRVGIAVKGLEEPWVLGSNELARLLVSPQLGVVSSGAEGLADNGPYLVLVVGVEVDAALLGALPALRNAFVDVRLVNDFGNELRRMVDCARVGRGQLSAKDGILPAGGDQKAKQCPDTVNGETEDQGGHEQEDGDASPHVGGCCRRQVSFSSGVVVYGAKAGREACSRGRGRRGKEVVAGSQVRRQRRSIPVPGGREDEKRGRAGAIKAGRGGLRAERERQCSTPISVAAARQGSGVGTALCGCEQAATNCSPPAHQLDASPLNFCMTGTVVPLTTATCLRGLILPYCTAVPLYLACPACFISHLGSLCLGRRYS
jgi:hypothetical protein